MPQLFANIEGLDGRVLRMMSYLNGLVEHSKGGPTDRTGILLKVGICIGWWACSSETPTSG